MKNVICVFAAVILLCALNLGAQAGEKTFSETEKATTQFMATSERSLTENLSGSTSRPTPLTEGEPGVPKVRERLGTPPSGSIFQAGSDPIPPNLAGCGGEPFCNGNPGTCCCCECRSLYGINACVAIGGPVHLCEYTSCQSDGGGD